VTALEAAIRLAPVARILNTSRMRCTKLCGVIETAGAQTAARRRKPACAFRRLSGSLT